MKRMPDEVKKIWRDVVNNAPGALIAGGAVRDTLNDNFIKDVDIFVHQHWAYLFTQTFTNSKWKKMTNGSSIVHNGPPAHVTYASGQLKASPHTFGVAPSVSIGSMTGHINSWQVQAEATTTYNNNNIVEVWEHDDYSSEWDYPINVIFTAIDPLEYVTTGFDYGICKAWYDGSYIGMHTDFTNDVNNKTITLTLTEEQLIKLYGSVKRGLLETEAHGLRLQRKYPNHTMVRPVIV